MAIVDPDVVALAVPEQQVDKLIAAYEGSFSVPLNGTATTTISHDLGTACLSELLWSIDNSNFYLAGSELSSSLCCTNGVGTNTATIYGGYRVSGAATTIFYKLYLIWPS